MALCCAVASPARAEDNKGGAAGRGAKDAQTPGPRPGGKAGSKQDDDAMRVKGGTATIGGKAGDKKGADESVPAGGTKPATFKRSGQKALDPGYDPAKTTKKLGADDKETTGGRKGDGKGDGKGEGDGPKKVEDSVTFKSNFDKDIKCRKMPLNAKVNLDFDQAPLDEITKLISCWTEKNFIVAVSKKDAKVTILSPKPVTVYEAYRAFLSALDVNGLTVVPTGRFLKIVESAAAKSDAPIVGPRGKVPNDEAIVTRLIPIEHIEAKELEPLLGKFKTKAGDIHIYGPSNTIILTDTGTNVRRLMRLIREVDVPIGKEKIWIRPVQYAQASELVDKLSQIFGDKAGGKGAVAGGRSKSPPPQPADGRRPEPARGAESTETVAVSVSKILSDDRTNQLIIVANRSSYLRVDRLIRKLDVPIPGEGQIHIHYLENADAEEISSTLSALAGGGGGGGGAKGGASKGGATKGGGSKSAAPHGGARPAAGGGGAGGGGSAALFEGDVKITAHKPTNSLVVEASLKDYLNLTKVIQKLDVRRKQVYVEAVIMEISTSKNNKTQLGGSTGTTFEVGGNTVPFLLGLGGLGVGSPNFQQLNSGGLASGLQGPLLQLNTGSLGSVTGSSTSVSLAIPAYGFLIQAIQENNDINVLSTPHILTLDNEEAEIQVGRKIPYRSASFGGGRGGLGGLGGLGSRGGLGGLGGLGAMGGIGSALGGLGGLGMLGGLGGMGMGTVQFIDVDMTLRITPQINESDFVKLKIEEELAELEGIDPNLGPTTSKRKVQNTVVVRDQQPIVIGGLITDRETDGVAKVPFLGDLPLLGIFFRKSEKRLEKKNLMLVIVPHIIKDPSDLKRIQEEKQEELRKFAELLATRNKEYQGQIDYRKKKGFLEEINSAIDKSRREREQQEKAYFENSDLDQVGPPDAHDLEYDPYARTRKDKSPKKAPATPKDGGDDDGDDEEATKKPAPKAKAERKGDKKPDASPATEPDVIDLDK